MKLSAIVLLLLITGYSQAQDEFQFQPQFQDSAVSQTQVQTEMPTPAKPQNIDDICDLFTQYPQWYLDAKAAAEKWGIPIHVQMATIYEESKFEAAARPPYDKYLWGVVPVHRQSSAAGFGQVLEGSWQAYEKSVGHTASRQRFAAVTDFIGWYANLMHKAVGVPLHNAYSFYLAYHEGPEGYKHHSYLHKSWLIQVAFNVQKRAQTYYRQLQSCQDKLEQLVDQHTVVSFGKRTVITENTLPTEYSVKLIL